MENSGWVKLHRQFLEWEWYSDANTSRLFFHLLLTVNFESKKWRGQVIERGSRLYGLEQLSIETGLTISKLRTALKNLKSTGEIANKTTPKGSIVSITNYEKYQSSDKQDDKQMTNRSQTDDKQIATTKEYKKERNKELKKELVIPEGISLPSNFELFLQFRKEKKSPITQTQLLPFLKKVMKLAVESNCEPEEILEQSIASGYIGIFELKGNKNGTHKQTTGENYGEAERNTSKNSRVRDSLRRGAREIFSTPQDGVDSDAPRAILPLLEHLR